MGFLAGGLSFRQGPQFYVIQAPFQMVTNFLISQTFYRELCNEQVVVSVEAEN